MSTHLDVPPILPFRLFTGTSRVPPDFLVGVLAGSLVGVTAGFLGASGVPPNSWGEDTPPE